MNNFEITEYFCTECEKDIEPKNVHMDYGFVKWHKFKSKSLYKNIKTVKNKHLCICEKCFQNYANEYVRYHAPKYY